MSVQSVMVPFAAVWSLVEAHREALEQAILEHLQRVPSFAPVLRELRPDDPAVLADAERARTLMRGALVDGDFAPYLAHLRAQGRRYARQGLTLSDWYGLLEPYRAVLVPAAIRTVPPDTLAGVLLALDAYVDLAMREIGQAYLDESVALVRVAEGERDQYARLFEACPLGMAIHRVDADGSRSRAGVNPAGLRIAEVLGLTPHERTVWLEGFDRDVREVLARGEPRESQVESPQHVIRQVLMRLDAEHVGVIYEDTTERERNRRELVRTVAELERSNRDLDQFAYVASHDLRSPMRDIHNLAEWLAEDLGPDLPAASARHLQRLRARVVRMESLLEDLLQYSRAGRTSIHTEPVGIGEAVAAAIALVGVPPGFDVAVDGPPLVVHTPRAPLELVLRNLIGNALKHHHRDVGAVHVRWARRGPAAEVEVVDDGPGIAPEFRERVFELFQTLRPRDAVEGSGMGLSIVRRVVEAYGGRVSVGAGPAGAGAAFRFTWPLRWDQGKG